MILRGRWRNNTDVSHMIIGREENITKPIILIPEAGHGNSYDFFKGLSEIAELHFVKERWTEEEWVEGIERYNAVMITSQHPINSRIIDAATNLRIIAKRGAKPENVDIEAATKKGIIVTWTPGVNSIAVAEHSIMLMLCLSKQTIPQMNKLKNGAWRLPSPGIRELDGQTIGIVGLGAIGKEVARLARGLRMLILAYDPYVDQNQAEVIGAKLVGLDELLRESDYVTLHAMLTEETGQLINEKRLKLMKKEAYLINTARGGLVDESALIKALKSGIIAGAGLDVFKNEPPQQRNPLLTLPNVVVTPHMAGWSEEALFRELKEAAIEIKLVLEGKIPRYPLNPEVLYND